MFYHGNPVRKMFEILGRKLLTAVLTAGTTFHVVFRVDYGQDEEHVFTDLQSWYKRKMDQALLGSEAQDELKDIKIRFENQRRRDGDEKNK